MRRESSTVVALVGEVTGELLAFLGRTPNVSVARPPAGAVSDQDAATLATGRSGWEAGALAMSQAARLHSMYVIVPADPLAEVAAAWRQMWDPAGGSPGALGFESSAADALAAWRDKRFELPDYYLVIAPAQGAEVGPDLYLGPLRAVRPRRVAVAGLADSPAQSASLLDALRSLEHGPWWPPLSDLLDAARGFYAGGLAETQQLAT
jgi:CelD/BcsL family acetyltransferase involved in cellulose biosynthesis